MIKTQEYGDGMFWFTEDGESFLLGITQKALDVAGSINGMDLSDVDDEVDAGEWLGEVRGKNSTIDILAPFAVRILELNEELHEQPAIIEDDPTGDAWILRVEKRDE